MNGIDHLKRTVTIKPTTGTMIFIQAIIRTDISPTGLNKLLSQYEMMDRYSIESIK